MKIRLNIRLILWRNGKRINGANRYIKARILRLAQVEMWDKAYLCVTYDGKLGQINEGYYENFKDLKEALSAFTEQGLISYVLGGKDEQRT